MVCATDNSCRIAQPNPYRTVAAGTCDGTLFGGDLVLASTLGLLDRVEPGRQVRLEHFTTGASDTHRQDRRRDRAIRTWSATATGRMLLAWESGLVDGGARCTTPAPARPSAASSRSRVKDHDYQAFKAYSDGSAAYPAAGSSSTSIRIARVMPLSS